MNRATSRHQARLALLLIGAGLLLAGASPDAARSAQPEVAVPDPAEITGIIKKHPNGETTIAPEAAHGESIHIQTGNMRTEALDNFPVVLNFLPGTPGLPPTVSRVRLQPVAEWDRLSHRSSETLSAESLQSVGTEV